MDAAKKEKLNLRMKTSSLPEDEKREGSF